ncbi:type II secretion system minor pseudopilin GspJ [Marinobacterium jannaschii]|uniref:type II secretion system minor pseudopilin GspJ n=1 Tax=Marinobacterium jannaschii TaxID=64970 RepID=UPI00048768D6|nr:type II secretion system minor pseudopilin GspJ [Marinobacterium jannaschii]
MNKPARQQTGFTLLELLIAVALLALLGLAGALTLDSSIRAEERISQRDQQLQLLDRAILLLQHDLEQALPRANKALEADVDARALWAYPEARLSDNVLLEFVRHNQSLSHPVLQRVRYRLEERSLWRDSIDLADPAEPRWQSRRLLNDVSELKQSFYQQRWLDEWQPKGSQLKQLPQAIRIVLSTRHWSELTFILPLGVSANAS